MTLVEQIKAVYPQLTDLDFLYNIVVKDNSDGNGPFIAEWNLTLPKPTQADLDSAPIPLQLIESVVVELVQKKLDEFAATRRYNGILSACTYVNSKVPQFQIEGQYCVDARDAHWAKCYSILSDVLSGTRPQPTVEEVLTELPILAWPPPPP